MSYAKTFYASNVSARMPNADELNPVLVEIECTALPTGVQRIGILGVGEKRAGEIRTRILSALDSLGLAAPKHPVTINIYSPIEFGDKANLDVPCALALMAATGIGNVTPESIRDKLLYGQLGLDGIVRCPVVSEAPSLSAETAAEKHGLAAVHCLTPDVTLTDIANRCLDTCIP